MLGRFALVLRTGWVRDFEPLRLAQSPIPATILAYLGRHGHHLAMTEADNPIAGEQALSHCVQFLITEQFYQHIGVAL
jgi:hypothetical protein